MPALKSKEPLRLIEAERRVREGWQRVARLEVQLALLNRARDPVSVQRAEALLCTVRETQRLLVMSLAKLRHGGGEASRSSSASRD